MHVKRIGAVILTIAMFATVLPLTALAATGLADTPPTTPPETLGPNLLVNPGMEGHYHQQCSLRSGPPWVPFPCDPKNYDYVSLNLWATAQVPDGWAAWWRVPNSDQQDPNYFNTYPSYCDFSKKSTPAECLPYHNPEFRDTLGGPQEHTPSRKFAGDNSQKYFTYYTVHDAGLYQTVGGVQPGDKLRFSVWMEAWSSPYNDPWHSDLAQRMNLQVGIDPTGGNNPWSSNIVWSTPQESFDKFTQFSVDAVAKNNVVSVWTRSNPFYAVQHNDVYVDEASLNVVNPAKAAAPAPKRTTTTKVITTTRVVTSTSGITSTVIFTRTIVVPVSVISRSTAITSTRATTRTVSSSRVTTPVTSTRATTGTLSSSAASTPISGTLAIPASGTYTVVRGDTLIAIARRFGIRPWMKLAELNDLQEPYKIEVGQVLILK